MTLVTQGVTLGVTEPRTLPQALAEAARGREGYTFLDGRAERRRSYAEIYQASRRRAAEYRVMGLGPGDVVALIVSDAEEFLTALFAVSLAGAVPAALYPPASAADLAHYLDSTLLILRSARARAVVTSRAIADAVEARRTTCPDLELVVSVADREADPAGSAPHTSELSVEAHSAKAEDVAFVQFTSGSTSRPKGVAITHRSLAANIDAINGPGGLATTASDSAVSWLPLYHDMGLVGMALGAMYSGRPAVLMTPATFVKRPVEWLRAISRQRATVSFAPNFGYDLCVRRVKESEMEGLDLSCWRVAGCGAEPIHAATLAAFADRFRHVGFRETSFLPSYGLAEHVLAATFAPRGRWVRTEPRSGVDLVSCGSPLPGHQLRIVAEDGGDLPERAIGEIALSGPSVMLGYWGDAPATEGVLRNGWLLTGDLGYVAEGELFVCGRSKDTIVVNARKHYAQDLEWAVADTSGLRRGRAVAFGASRAGQADRVVIVVEASGAVAADHLAQAIRLRVSEVCGLFVDDVVLVPSGTITRTTSGKVQRAALRARYEEGTLAKLEVKSEKCEGR